MTKLFVAVGLPAFTCAALARLQPPMTPGIRLVDPEQMHLTLHYVGSADLDGLASALQSVRSPAFRLAFEGVGAFASVGGSTTLWAGIKDSPELLRLHAAIATVLDREGHKLEARAYSPHVTLARCEPFFSADMSDAFLARQADFSMPPVEIRGFGLYSSTMADSVPVYKRERQFSFFAES